MYNFGWKDSSQAPWPLLVTKHNKNDHNQNLIQLFQQLSRYNQGKGNAVARCCFYKWPQLPHHHQTFSSEAHAVEDKKAGRIKSFQWGPKLPFRVTFCSWNDMIRLSLNFGIRGSEVEGSGTALLCVYTLQTRGVGPLGWPPEIRRFNIARLPFDWRGVWQPHKKSKIRDWRSLSGKKHLLQRGPGGAGVTSKVRVTHPGLQS